MSNSIEKVHKTILIIADEIDRICSKYSIPYSIDSGTLLGAVRHKGFIPWDDDFDVAMKRKDYERFEEVCKKELDTSMFFLQTKDTELFYPFAFAKLQLNGTEFLDGFSDRASVRHGVFVDIFIMDNLPGNRCQEKILLLKNKFLRNLLWIKCGYGTDEHRRSLKYQFLKVISKIFSVEKLKQMRDKLIILYNRQEAKYLFFSDYPQFRLPASFFSSYKQYEFENRMYQGITNYDEYLTLLYGDYMKIPPEEDRMIHSNGTINLGKYEQED